MAAEMITWLSRGSPVSGDNWGGKNRSLVALTGAGLPVPPGFAVSAAAFRAALEGDGAVGRLATSVSSVDPGDPAALARCGTESRALVQRAGLPRATAAQLDDAYAILSRGFHVENLPVAVRSSAVCEDLPGLTAAGAHDSYLGVRTPEAVRDRVLRCWASLYNDRAIAYRRHHAVVENDVAMSVTVQRLVPAEVAGVAFTVDPMTGDDGHVVVEASWGLGEAVVSGAVVPDYYLVGKHSGTIVEHRVGTKAREFRLGEDGVVGDRDVTAARRRVPCLADDEVREVVELACRAERLFDAAQDVEWAVERTSPGERRVWLMQSRPESVWQGRRRS
ncbi:PEP/pyruvate-binding domain-containing protein [Actinoplanes couchii]|uniref:Phosphoenolpyruvate synthase n=1 Tax=Actinoplanes couchii TaxID=403638 RepID=A0ABQ3XSD9_9ACTN|nr:PEP/pyruvate-binding domain-containing protein [Actinoplanes couchii]MDR6315924.1 pyruvate,water dikinase [Actinoplanes couchii]GID61426.1 hypothetical protein Aco03nite_098300 [Actinoplanes couchii]